MYGTCGKTIKETERNIHTNQTNPHKNQRQVEESTRKHHKIKQIKGIKGNPMNLFKSMNITGTLKKSNIYIYIYIYISYP